MQLAFPMYIFIMFAIELWIYIDSDSVGPGDAQADW